MPYCRINHRHRGATYIRGKMYTKTYKFWSLKKRFSLSRNQTSWALSTLTYHHFIVFRLATSKQLRLKIRNCSYFSGIVTKNRDTGVKLATVTGKIGTLVTVLMGIRPRKTLTLVKVLCYRTGLPTYTMPVKQCKNQS